MSWETHVKWEPLTVHGPARAPLYSTYSLLWFLMVHINPWSLPVHVCTQMCVSLVTDSEKMSREGKKADKGNRDWKAKRTRARGA